MSLPAVRIHNQITEPQRGAVAQVRSGMRERPQLDMVLAGWRSIFNGIENFGQGVREVGKTITSWGKRMNQIDADNASADIRAAASGVSAYHKTFWGGF